MTDANERPTFESRLEEIRWLFSPFESGVQCDCEQCTAARQLLAFVDAYLHGKTPSEMTINKYNMCFEDQDDLDRWRDDVQNSLKALT